MINVLKYCTPTFLTKWHLQTGTVLSGSALFAYTILFYLPSHQVLCETNEQSCIRSFRAFIVCEIHLVYVCSLNRVYIVQQKDTLWIWILKSMTAKNRCPDRTCFFPYFSTKIYIVGIEAPWKGKIRKIIISISLIAPFFLPCNFPLLLHIFPLPRRGWGAGWC